MVISFLQVLQESVTKLLPGGEKKAAELPLIAIGAMAGTVIVKGSIWFACIRVKTTQVQALAQGTSFSLSSWYFHSISHRLQNGRLLQHPVSFVPIHWSQSQYLVAWPRWCSSAFPLHHLWLGKHLFWEYNSTEWFCHWRLPSKEVDILGLSVFSCRGWL